MRILRGIRMMLVQMITRATCHCEMRATCFPEGGVPTGRETGLRVGLNGYMHRRYEEWVWRLVWPCKGEGNGYEVQPRVARETWVRWCYS